MWDIHVSQCAQQVLYEEITKREYEGKDKKILYIKRIVINIVILGILAASLYGIYAVGLTPPPPRAARVILILP